MNKKYIYIKIMELHKRVYYGTKIIYYIIFGLSLIGVYIVSPTLLPVITNLVKLYIAVLLIRKFNPYLPAGTPVRTYDKELIFSSAIFLLLTTTFGDILQTYGHLLIERLK